MVELPLGPEKVAPGYMLHPYLREKGIWKQKDLETRISF